MYSTGHYSTWSPVVYCSTYLEVNLLFGLIIYSRTRPHVHGSPYSNQGFFISSPNHLKSVVGSRPSASVIRWQFFVGSVGPYLIDWITQMFHASALMVAKRLGSAKQLPLQSSKKQTINNRNMLIWPVFVQSCSYFTFIYAYTLFIPALLTLLNSVHLMLIYMRQVLPQQKSSYPTSTRLKHSSDQ